MNTEEIKNFLIQANRNGYGNALVKPSDEVDGSHTITYKEANWLFNDNYFGGEPFGGREIISHQDKTIWMMVYYGFVINMTLQTEIYGFLKKALLNFTEDMPYRGPEKLEDGDWLYINKVTGYFDRFSGEETITFKNNEVYCAKYQGGLVNC